jgi:EAL domain-containing protein (putative c-di-GMP-specific phosphodiesterase class I)
MLDSELASHLEHAVERGEIFAVYQPQVALAGGGIVAAEALARWRHPQRGLVPVGEFIPLAEATGSIHGIGRFMLDECLAALDRWGRDGVTMGLSVNVSTLQLAGSTFTDYLGEQLRSRLMPSRTLSIEVTESRPLPADETISDRLTALASLGLGISLDDFGTGHASESQLERLPVTELKLDRSLIQHPAEYLRGSIMSSISRARDRGLRLVAEGVETAAHLRSAVGMGCDRAQGFLFGAPMRLGELNALLAG